MDMPYRRDRKNAPNMQMVRNEAQKIAFAPMIFQAVKAMLDFKLLSSIAESEKGLTYEAIKIHTGLTDYAVQVLTDIAIYADILKKDNDNFTVTRVGRCFLDDDTTIVNFNFINDVCYSGAFHLKESLKTGKPEGLKVFGNWETVYQGLCELPADARKSWFDFDNFYSDVSFSEAIDILMHNTPKMVYDVGANSGKFGKILLSKYDKPALTCFDLPNQLMIAEKTINNPRAKYINIDILKNDLPKGADAIWMSQFLDCFSPEKIESILKKASSALNPNGRIFIFEPFIDNQRSKSGALSLSGTSLYFTCIANGYSKMYNQSEFEQFVKNAGLQLHKVHSNIGDFDYTLLECINAMV